MNSRALLLRRLLPLPLLLALLGAIAGSLGTAAAPLSAAAAGIEPGTANATAVDLDATYDVDLAVRYGDRALRLDSTATVTQHNEGADRPARAEHGGREARRAWHWTVVSVDGRRVAATVSDQTIVVPLGGVLPPGGDDERPRHLPRHAAPRHIRLRLVLHAGPAGSSSCTGSMPWVSLRHPFDRSNHGDPFVTATSRRVTLKLTTDRPMTVAINARRTSISNGGRVQTFVADERARPPARPGARLPRDAVDARRQRDPGLYGRPAVGPPP